jgi:GDPmannose 4,6-dehydratase|tara:strand:- start:104 stop:1084 length:981 start_codon:yes stop_codon:yes gene_type:complete
MKKKAFITGISGQDGSYLAELLVENDYEVYGIIRRHSIAESQETRIDHLVSKGLVKTDYGDLLDNSSLYKMLALIKPDEIYNLGAQSHVRVSFDVPQFTMQTNMIGTLNLLEAYRSICPKSKFYQASSSEMFGNEIDEDGFQRETTAMKPVSPYGCSKLAAYCIVRNYRNSYNLFASNGILFNHESPRRGENFVTAKIARGAAAIKKKQLDKLELGNLDASRDWGHSKDYVDAMHKILQHHEPDEFVISSQESHTVRDFCESAFSHVGLDYKDYVTQNPKFMRPEELKTLKGDSTKSRTALNWKPEYNFDSLVKDMVDYWMEKLED